MKLSTVNVIEIADRLIIGITSFPDTKAGSKEAEKLFKSVIRDNYTVKDISNKDLEACLEDGKFEYGDDQIFIVHST